MWREQKYIQEGLGGRGGYPTNFGRLQFLTWTKFGKTLYLLKAFQTEKCD